MLGERHLNTEMVAAGFIKSEVAGSDRVRVFWALTESLGLSFEDESLALASKTVVVEVSEVRYSESFLFSPTLLLDGVPLSADLQPAAVKLPVVDFVDVFLPRAHMLFVLECVRRNCGVQVNSSVN